MRRIVLGIALALIASAASAQTVQTGSVFWNGTWAPPQPTTQYLQSCNGGAGGIVGQGSCTAGGYGAGFSTTPDQGSGASTASTLRVIQSTDSLIGLRAGTNNIGVVSTAPSTGTTTRTNGTITAINTFQSVLAANTARKACRITNTSATAMTLDVGASPAAATAIPLPAGAAFLCGTGDGFVISDQINLADATSGSTFVVWSQ